MYQPDNGSPEFFTDQKEREHIRSIIKTFKEYKRCATRAIEQRRESLTKIPEQDRFLLHQYEAHLSRLKQLAAENQKFLDEIIDDVEDVFSNVDLMTGTQIEDESSLPEPDSMNIDKLRTTLRQIVRDWSTHGAEERKQCYQPIEEAIETYFKNRDRKDVFVLVPGAGLGRLAFNLAAKGFSCQGNEVSMFMLLSSHYLINRGIRIGSRRIYPWITNFCNNLHFADQCEAVSVPDIETHAANARHFTMIAGNFLNVYTRPESWDCVATSFFLDTANNVVEYIRRIYLILKPGGLWVNMGPLLYHFSDMPGHLSIELPYEVIKGLIESIGFRITDERLNVKTRYLHQPSSLLSYEYKSIFFTAVKPH